MSFFGVATLRVAQATPGYALVDDPVGGAVVLLGVSWATCLVGALAWHRRPVDRTGPLLVAASLSWLVSQWASPGAGAVFGPLAAPAFTAGLVLTGGVPFLMAYLALAYPGGRLRTKARRVLTIAGFTVMVLLLGAAASMFLDPLRQGCACPDNWLLVSNEPELSSTVSRVSLGLGALWALLTAGLLVLTLVGARPAVRRIAIPVVAPAAACLLLSATLFAAGTRRGYLGTSGLSAELRLAQAATVLAVTLGVGWGLLRARRVQATLARSVVRQVDPPGRPLRADLADLLGDPDLVIAHRLDDGRVVDSEARPVALTPSAGREVTTIPLAGSTVLLVHRAGALDSPVLREALTSSAGLALTNDRLRARTLAQIAELQASQIRIVQTGDAERRRLERDLHDGAQQRLVGILLGLRLLHRTSAASTEPLQQAELEVSRAIDDLRTLSHGLFPAVLSDAGLAEALHALAETHPLKVGPVPKIRFPVEMETTAYLVVAQAASTGATSVDASRSADHLAVRINTRGSVDLRGVRDRITALTGTISVEQKGQDSRIVLHLPLGATEGPSPP